MSQWSRESVAAPRPAQVRRCARRLPGVNTAAMSEPWFTRSPANSPDRPPAGASTTTAEGHTPSTAEAGTQEAPGAAPAGLPAATAAATPGATIDVTPGATIDITVNGASRRIAAGATVAALLAELGLGDRRVAVERNREVVPRAEHARAVLAAGDHLEVVTFVGGG
jgi:sulfur carrier protein